MQEYLKRVIVTVFNNWTALQLAVEHSMGGPYSRQKAVQMVDYLINYIVNNPNVEVEDLEDVLEESLDQEFSTICEDNSVREISQVLYGFTQILKAGNLPQYEFEFAKLPSGKEWLTQNNPTQVVNTQDSSDDDDDDDEADMNAPSTSSKQDSVPAPMDEDPEWTTVTRKKR